MEARKDWVTLNRSSAASTAALTSANTPSTWSRLSSASTRAAVAARWDADPGICITTTNNKGALREVS